MSFKMFRYLEKHYTGQYRVKARYDLDTEDFPRNYREEVEEDFDEQYIPCRRGEIRATYKTKRGKDILAWYCESIPMALKVYQEVKEKYPDIEFSPDEDLGLDDEEVRGRLGRKSDALIYFNAEDIDKIAEIVGASTRGARIKPYSIKNLPREKYIIPEEDLQLYVDAIDKYEQMDKARFVKLGNKKFIADHEKQIGNPNASKLNIKELIHSKGLWGEYIEFLNKTTLEDLQDGN